MKSKIFFTASLIILVGLRNFTFGQCIAINNLPDTINACKFTQVQLNATVTSSGQLAVLDTLWTPPGGLTDPNIINPVASVGNVPIQYKLTVTALGPNNLVTNGDFSAGNSGFTSGYVYGTGGPWGILSLEGQYAIATSPSLTHSAFASYGDHTTGSGNMMVVNGAATPNVSIWCQTINVQPNTDYQFSTWVSTAYTQSPAILQFSINNVLIGTPFNAPVTTGVWAKFFATWNSGSNSTATICITNQNTAVAGNDFAIDDIDFRPVCIATDSVYIKVTNLAPSFDTVMRLGCESDTVIFTAINGGDTPDQYIWDFGDGTGDTAQNPTHIYPVQGIYTVKLVTKKNGCKDSAFTTVNTIHIVTAGFTISDDSVCIGETIQFTSTAGSTYPLTYDWDFGDGGTSIVKDPTYTYNIPGVYTVRQIVTDIIPCTDTISYQVVVSTFPSVNVALNDSVICEGKAIEVSANIESGYSSYYWDFGDGNRINNQPSVGHAYDSSGLYTITLLVDYIVCPDVTVTKTVEVHPMPRIDLGPDTSMCPYSEPIAVSNPYFDALDIYKWNTGETKNAIIVRHPAIYWLTVTSPFGCETNDSIQVFKSCYIDIPNAFSPDGDNLNDYFFPRQLLSKEITRFHMQIFDRWGMLIFETRKLDGRGWDGKFNDKPQPMGVYVYLIEAEIGGQWVEKYNGNVTLLR
jgi:gliding motility-associated-like protein